MRFNLLKNISIKTNLSHLYDHRACVVFVQDPKHLHYYSFYYHLKNNINTYFEIFN